MKIIKLIKKINDMFWHMLSFIPIFLKKISVDIMHLSTQLQHRQNMQKNCWCILIILFILGWPLSLLLGIILFSSSARTKQIIYDIISILMILFIVWAIISPFSFIPYDIVPVDDLQERIYISINPIRASLACVYYQLAYRTADFRNKKPDELAVELAEKDEEIKTYEEKGER